MDPKADLLNQLKDIDLPDPSGWWIAPGWFLVPLALLVGCWVGYKRWINYRIGKRTNWRPEARASIEQLRSDIDKGYYDDVVSGASRLARRIAIARVGRENVAKLTGDRWLKKLDSIGNTQSFTTGAGRLLSTAPYRSGRIEDQALLHDVVNAVETLISDSELAGNPFSGPVSSSASGSVSEKPT